MQKQIYVPDSKADLFERAAKYGDSMSAVVVEALEKFVAAREADAAGMIEHTINVGEHRNADGEFHGSKKKFIDRKLVSRRVAADANGNSGTEWAIYKTAKGFLVYWDNWSRWQNATTSSGYAAVKKLTHSMEINAKSVDGYDYPITVPPHVLEAALEEAGEDPVEMLDV